MWHVWWAVGGAAAYLVLTAAVSWWLHRLRLEWHTWRLLSHARERLARERELTHRARVLAAQTVLRWPGERPWGSGGGADGDAAAGGDRDGDSDGEGEA